MAEGEYSSQPLGEGGLFCEKTQRQMEKAVQNREGLRTGKV